MQVSWNDVNRAERMGPQIVARIGIDVFVQERHIKNWKADPDGQHRIIEISTTLGKIYSLGEFKLSQED